MAQGCAAPGSLSLCELLDAHAGPVTADFLRYYGVDIRDLFRPGSDLSPARAIALVEGLPIDSSLSVSLRGGPAHSGWDRHAHILADIYDGLAGLVYVTMAANSRNPRKVEKPSEYPRPEVDTGTKKEPDILLLRLRAEDSKPSEAAPGRLIPLPPSK